MWNNGELLADGGYVNNLPVDVMRRIVKSGKVIAVDVENKDRSAFTGCDNLLDSQGGLSGWSLLGRRILSKFFDVGAKWPDAQAMHEWLSFMSNNRGIEKFVRKGYIDLYILPPAMSQFHLLDYQKMDVIVKSGYTYALHKLSIWKQEESPALLPRQSFPGGQRRSSRSLDDGDALEIKNRSSSMLSFLHHNSQQNSQASTATKLVKNRSKGSLTVRSVENLSFSMVMDDDAEVF